MKIWNLRLFQGFTWLFVIGMRNYFHFNFRVNGGWDDNSEWRFQTSLDQWGQFNGIQSFSRLITQNRLNLRLFKALIWGGN